MRRGLRLLVSLNLPLSENIILFANGMFSKVRTENIKENQNE